MCLRSCNLLIQMRRQYRSNMSIVFNELPGRTANGLFFTRGPDQHNQCFYILLYSAMSIISSSMSFIHKQYEKLININK